MCWATPCLKRVRSSHASGHVWTGKVPLYFDRIAAVPEDLDLVPPPRSRSPQAWPAWKRCYICRAQALGAAGKNDPYLPSAMPQECAAAFRRMPVGTLLADGGPREREG